VPFRETIVPPPQTDMVNEAIEAENNRIAADSTDSSGVAVLETPNKQCRFSVRAVPLPREFTRLLENSHALLKALASKAELTSGAQQDIDELKARLAAAAQSEEALRACTDQILSFGPKRAGPNILVNAVPGLHVTPAWSSRESRARGGDEDPRADFASSVVNGFQLAALAGPICEEPMMGVAFILEEWTLREEGETGWGPVSGQIVSTVKVRRRLSILISSFLSTF
jgi:ribosome assembly protein 1